MNNLTYPRGALLYNINCNEIEDMPKKLPLFSNRMRKWMVSITPAFDYAMVQMAEAMLDKMVRNKQISSALAGSMHKMLQEDYCTGSVISLPNYSQQSTVLNNRIWKRLFSKVDRVPDIVYLEQEKIVGTLLESDLSNPESLAWCVMFDQLLSKQVLMELDGVKGCWKRIKLAQRLCSMTADDKILRVLEDCGTVFFWGIDQKGKRVPVCIETDTSDCKMLRGVDNRGDVWILPYTPQAVIEGLKNGKLIPSIFTNFLVLSFARGVICVGAYFQSEYLPAMQSGIVRALRKTNGYNNLADFVSEIPGDRYLSGMLAVMTIINNRCLVPAGPVEIIAGGGLTSNDFERILSLTVEDAHLAGLFETVPDSVQPAFRSSNWKHRLAEDCLRLLAQKVVIK
ncbi:MAG: hypothetical protein GY795_32400 [Desulfobacterales bacterium]|nr:hypothetical protein [Desulfobacterales bacterium]